MVEDRTANVEEDQSVWSEDVVGEGDDAEVMQDLLLVPQRRTMSQGFASLDCVSSRSELWSREQFRCS